MPRVMFSEKAWEEYLWWQTQDRKKLKRINALLQQIGRGYCIRVHARSAQLPVHNDEKHSDYGRQQKQQNKVEQKPDMDASEIGYAQAAHHGFPSSPCYIYLLQFTTQSVLHA